MGPSLRAGWQQHRRTRRGLADFDLGLDYRSNHQILAYWINRLRQSLERDPESPAIILGDLETGFRLQRME